jgi:hypothetical protein
MIGVKCFALYVSIGNHGLGHDHISFFWNESIFQMGFYFFYERDLEFEHVFWYIYEGV